MKFNRLSSSAPWVLAAVFLVSTLVAMPARAHAFDFGRLIDPACFFACDDSPKKTVKRVTNNYTNSNNTNSNINSPGGVVNGNTSGGGVAVSGYDGHDDYDDYDDYHGGHSGHDSHPPLQVSCYADETSVETGDTVHWRAVVYGGDGDYDYDWSGTDNLKGDDDDVSKRYTRSGSKTASVRVSSDGESFTRHCDGAVRVYDDRDYDDDYYHGHDYYDDDYYYDDYYYNYYPLSVSCSVNTTFAPAGTRVTWTAYASGGSDGYDYDWSGTDGLRGSGRSITTYYTGSGPKYASVTVRSRGQSMTQSCTNYVTIGYPVGQNQPPYGSGGSLQIGCYGSPTSARIDQPVTWTAEVTGGAAPYTYSWSGANGLSGSQSSVTTYYGSAGEKNAVVTVTSADGRTGSHVCTNSVSVRSAAPSGGSARPAPQPQPDNGLSAASLFSLQNVPWGLVAILIILVLFATVLYLLFNRQKI